MQNADKREVNIECRQNGGKCRMQTTQREMQTADKTEGNVECRQHRNQRRIQTAQR